MKSRLIFIIFIAILMLLASACDELMTGPSVKKKAICPVVHVDTIKFQVYITYLNLHGACIPPTVEDL